VRVAVTGANGLLGGEAVLQLVRAGHEVLALGRGASRLPRQASFPSGGAGQGEGAPAARGSFTWTSIDLAEPGSAAHALLDLRPDAVLHAGAATDVDACEREPDLAWRVNVAGTAEVARACRGLGARLVAVSTDYVFDGEAGPYAEDAVPNPRGVYARTKRCGEEAALVLAPGCAVARVAVVYSGRAGAKPTFATQVVEKLSRGEPVNAFSDQRVSTTLAASGAAMCLELLLETDHRGILHASDATVLTRVELAERIAREFGLSGAIRPVRTADAKLLAPRPLRGGLVTARAAALLRSKPLGIDEALRRFHEEWRARATAG
jgi:dTDP-4-dehydrorhamnose reductase